MESSIECYNTHENKKGNNLQLFTHHEIVFILITINILKIYFMQLLKQHL